jgi:hypothetical protein
MSLRWSCDSVPSWNGKNRRRSTIFFSRDMDEMSTRRVLRAGTTAAPELRGVHHGVAPPRVRKTREIPQKSNCFMYAANPAAAVILATAESYTVWHEFAFPMSLSYNIEGAMKSLVAMKSPIVKRSVITESRKTSVSDVLTEAVTGVVTAVIAAMAGARQVHTFRRAAGQPVSLLTPGTSAWSNSDAAMVNISGARAHSRNEVND